ncbi:MAG: DUF11 domain-containing protein, partial [Candidatus Acetothermia bacterium]|nr:DUF11 domain-containing protein [Candidatus Acetothermia bacterium]
WALENLPPGGMAQLTLTARETGCGELTNAVRVWWGCGQEGDESSCTLDADCLADAYAFREVVASRTPSVAVATTLNPTQVPSCGMTTVTLEIRNLSSATAEALDVRVQLPAGLTYVSGTTQVDCGGGFVLAPDPYEIGGYLYWYDSDNPLDNLCGEIGPGGTVRLRFAVQASCYRTVGNAAVRVYFYDCCFAAQQEFNGSYPLQPALPTLTVQKTPATVPLDCYDQSSTVTWQIRVQNTGAASADWVRVEDTLGASLQYLSSSPL